MPIKQTEHVEQFKFAPFSKKQLMVLGFWDYDKYKNKIDAVICDGSVRSGKTLSMIISFIEWSMTRYSRKQFGIAGQSVGSLRKNVIEPMKAALAGWSGFAIRDNRSEGTITIFSGSKHNTYYLYGGKDESSYKKVQGLTATGFFFDEVALQPESFVNQATTRVDDENGLLWFNCNPAGPYHWFYREWIVDDEHKHNCFKLHFRMEDNLYLTPKVIDRYKRSYSGVFYDRYILGKWVMAEGVVYPNFDKNTMVVTAPSVNECTKFVISADYGTQHPTVFLLWGYQPNDGVWYCLREYYHNGAQHSLYVTGYGSSGNVRDKSDEDYAADLAKFVADIHQSVPIVLDPAANNLAITLSQHHFRVVKANNAVNDGIRLTQIRMDDGKIKFTEDLPDVFREFGSYVWDAKAADRGEDKVIKTHDHSMDSIRYFCAYALPPVSDISGYQLIKDR